MLKYYNGLNFILVYVAVKKGSTFFIIQVSIFFWEISLFLKLHKMPSPSKDVF